MLDDLKKCHDIYGLADLLEIPAKMLTFLLYKLPEDKKYVEFCISKKNGKSRIIHAPEDRLKRLQRNLSNILYECQLDLEAHHGPSRSYGFQKNRGIYENALVHRNKRWVFNIDLEDFFPSINFGRVITFFKKNNDFQLNSKVATYIAQIACYEEKLPQGAPSSPIISNLLCGSLDYRLSRFARKNRCDYSRYADDITFSTNLADFPESIAKTDESSQGWIAGTELSERIQDAGFQLNPDKTRMSYRSDRQMVTGLVVNQKPNAPREFYKNTRATIHNILTGRPVKIDRFCDPFSDNCGDGEPKAETATAVSEILPVLEGRISFCHHISNRNDPRKDRAKFFNPSAVTKSYADLLRLKYFVFGNRPIILTEGPSDLLYIKSYLKSATQSISHLVDVDGSNNTIISDFYKFPSAPSSILGLSGGSGNLLLFMERHYHFLKRLTKSIKPRPMIILLDNDSGIKDLIPNLIKFYNTDISWKNDDKFYKLTSNMAVIKTPHLPTKIKTCVEDFIDPKAIATKINNRSFSNLDDFDPKTHFGKVELANHIYDNRNNYNFSRLDEIIQRISEAISTM